MTLLLEILRFIFGSGWSVLWNIPFLIAAGIFVVGPMALLAGDALKTPVTPASLGTIAYLAMIAVFLAVAAPIGVVVLLRSTGAGSGWIVLWALGSALAIGVLSFWILGRMCERGGRVWVAAGWILVACTLLGHLACLFAASSRGAAGRAASPIESAA